MLCLLAAFVWRGQWAFGQQNFAIRNNLLYDATLTPSLGVELRVDSTWTVGGTFGLNAWTINGNSDKKWRHLLAAVQTRKYLNDTILLKGYVEGGVAYSHFNVGNVRFPFGLYPSVRDQRRQGDLVALGLKYGYGWALARRWRLEAEAGVAAGYAWYRRYDCGHCGRDRGPGRKAFLLPLAGVNLVYVFGDGNREEKENEKTR